MIKGLIFDLDGTLLDTIDDIAYAMNEAVLEMGFKRHSIEKYKEMVGTGIHDLVEMVLPEEHRNRETIQNFIVCFRKHYALSWAKSTKPYPGIMELIDILKQRDLRLGILSNKSQAFTFEMAQHWFGMDNGKILDPIWGERSGVPLKPDPSAALHMAEIWGLDPKEIAFIGDSEVDIQTGISAGMLPIGVSWGFRRVEALRATGAEIILEKPIDLLDYI